MTDKENQIIIGLTGSLGSGKGVVSDFFKDKGYTSFVLSDVIRDYAKQHGIEETRENLQNIGNKLRDEDGADILAKIIYKKAKEKNLSKILVDGIRNPGEVDFFRKFDDFFLIAVNASRGKRFKMLVDRQREGDIISWEEFLKLDDRDSGVGEADSGQAVGKCIELADYRFVNESNLDHVRDRLEKLYLEIENKTLNVENEILDKENQIIYAVEVKHLFPTEDHYFEGFHLHNQTDFESLILNNLKEVKRGPAETDPTHKQPIAYTLIVNPINKTVFIYERAGHEERLHGNHSIGLGGHIEPVDSENGNPIRTSVHREVLGEEVRLTGQVVSTKVLGYLNDDSNEVGKVHFGILYLIETDGEVHAQDPEIKEGRLISLDELEKIFSAGNLENWSEIALGPLREYFAGL